MENPLLASKEIESQFENSIVNDQLVYKTYLNYELNDNSNKDFKEILSLTELIHSELEEK